MGGTLLKAREAGYRIVYVMSTNNTSGGVASLENGKVVSQLPVEPPALMSARRKREAGAAAAFLEAEIIHLDHPQRHYNTGQGKEKVKLEYGAKPPEGVSNDRPNILIASEDSESIARVKDLILQYDPELIFTHGINTSNIEHFATAALVARAFWAAVEQGYQGGMLQWVDAATVFGESSFHWDTFVDYSGRVDQKMALASLHACQKPDALLPGFGHRHLSHFWGRGCGVEAAECYCWVRRPTRIDRNISGVPQPALEN